jgi:hypothetical protein
MPHSSTPAHRNPQNNCNNRRTSTKQPPPRSQYSVPQDVGSVSLDYTLQATATAAAGSYALSGSVFISNVQPGILNIARLVVQLSTGQSAYPTCALTTPFTTQDGLIWGGVNAGGSITTMPFSASTGITNTGNVLGTWSQFILPEFASATCKFNISLGSTVGLFGDCC